MRKRIMKFLALLLSVALVLGTVNYTSQNVQADTGGAAAVSGNDVSGNNATSGNDPAGEEEEATTRYYTFKELGQGNAVNGEWGVTETVSDAGVLSASYTGKYAEAQYTLPTGVDGTTLKSIVLDVSSGTVANLAIKVYADGAEAQVEYGKDTITITADLSSASEFVIGIMNNVDEAADYVIDNIKITAVQTGGSETEPSTGGEEPATATARYYTFNDVTKASLGWGNTPSIDSETGVLTVAFSGENAEVVYDLPAGIDFSTLETITLDVSEGSGNLLALKIYIDGTEKYAKYQTSTITMDDATIALLADATTVSLGIMNQATEAAEYTIDNIKVTAVQTGGSETEPSTGGSTEDPAEASTRYYTFNDVTKASLGWGNTPSIDSETGVLTVAFSGENAEVVYDLPAGIDFSTLETITLDVSEGSGNLLALKIYIDGTEKYAKYQTSTITMDDATIALLADATTVSLGIMNQATEAAEYTIDNIKITAVQTGGSETEPSTGGSTEDPAEASTRYYTFNDVTAVGGYYNTPTVSEDGVLTIAYDQQYAERQYSIPAGVDVATLEAIEFDVSSGAATGLALKIYIDGTAKLTKYNTASVTIDDATKELLASATEVKVGIMNNASDAATYVIDNIKITAVQTGGSETEPSTGGSTEDPSAASTRYYTFNDVTAVGGYYNTPTVSEDGVLTIVYDQQYAERKYSLPEGVDGTTLSALVLAVSEGTASDLAIKIYADGTQAQVSYSNSITVTADLSEATEVTIGIMNNASDAATYVIDNIKITAVQTGGSETAPSTGTGGGSIDTSTNITPAAESEEDFSWKGSDLTKGYDTTTSELDSTTSRWNITFDSAWQEVRFELPEEVDLTMCNSVTFAVANQSTKMTFKMYTSDETEVGTQYHQTGSNLYEYSTTTSTDKIKYVAIMLHSDDKVEATETCAFDGVYFDMVAEDEVEETYEKTFTASELTKDWANSTTCEQTSAGWSITFSELNQEARFDLPESINLENCKTIKFTVSSQTGPVNFYVGADGTKIKSYWYNDGKTVYTHEPGVTNKINQIGIQCGGDAFTEGAAITLESVTFVMKGSEPLPTPTDGVYSAEFFGDVEETNDTETEVIIQEATATEDAAVIVEFYKENAGVIFEIPDTVDLNHLVSIDFAISKEEVSLMSTTLPDVKVELLDADKNPIITSTESNVETNCNPEIKYFKLTATKADVAIKLTSVTFNIDESAFEAIVLNGNFAREDVSMWGSALYGTVDGTEDGEATTITVKTSDTPIFDDVYTYGEISRRSSPYVGFAQNISDRVTPGKTYTFSFWAKLSDDYADAPANQREVTFSPYSINPDGTENYGITPTGGYKFSLTPGVWSKFSGTVTVPADATGFYIRIVEQGTNYGQGDCVLGSYAVTGVVMEEAQPVKIDWDNPAAQVPNYSVTYTMEELIVDWASATTEDVNGDLKISFAQNYSEARFKLPRSLDMSKVLSVVVNTDGQTVPIAIKLYNKGKEEWVKYGSTYYDEYVLYPDITGNVNGFGIMSLAIPNQEGSFAVFESITFNMTEEPAPIPVSKDIVTGGYFSTEEELDDWKAAFWGDGVTMTQVISETPVVDGIYTYASYSKRTSPYQCFAQDVTDKVEQNETYTFSFWARLSDDYIGAPEEMRTVQFAPYTVDMDGTADYNPKLEGTYSQVLEPGVWTKFEGKYKVTNANEIGQVIIRILEQGTNYGQGDCVLGGYDITGVIMEKYIPEPPSIDEDVPDLKDAITEVMGEGFIVGSAIAGDEGDDIGVEMLVNKHFNALTLGNELKPDALFGYSNSQHTKLQTITFNGQELVVPTLDFSRAEMLLDQIKEWNETHPEEPIKVRGHVLVWHTQTPEWFFRENYVVGKNADGSENYVSPEEMNLRLEWFIKTVLEHFTGEDSEYKDMFYGWDVVNEAISDSGNGYRTDKVSATEDPSADTHSKNSSWWAVYQSNEYIIKAFQYANKYAPADVELYYNDYNDADSKKVTGIVALLKDVLAAEGTRIDAMGMQGHYNLFNPSNKSIEKAIRAYAEVVGNVQYTELDFKASGDISSDQGREAEYLAQAERYHELYLLLQELDAEEGIEITGLTVWGTVDHHSWLQSASTVGGGGDGTMDQCPLLFDSNYKVKPSYWAFVDYTMVDPDWVPEVKEETTEDKTDDKTDDKADEKTDDKTGDDETKTDESASGEDSASTEESKADQDATSEQPTVKKSGNTALVIALVAVAVAAVAAVGTVLLKRKKK